MEVSLDEPENGTDGSMTENQKDSGLVESKDDADFAKADEDKTTKPDVVETSDAMAID